jgi:hypothetical protein
VAAAIDDPTEAHASPAGKVTAGTGRPGSWFSHRPGRDSGMAKDGGEQ